MYRIRIRLYILCYISVHWNTNTKWAAKHRVVFDGARVSSACIIHNIHSIHSIDARRRRFDRRARIHFAYLGVWCKWSRVADDETRHTHFPNYSLQRFRLTIIYWYTLARAPFALSRSCGAETSITRTRTKSACLRRASGIVPSWHNIKLLDNPSKIRTCVSFPGCALFTYIRHGQRYKLTRSGSLYSYVWIALQLVNVMYVCTIWKS